MSVIIRLQNLPWSANALDIRQYFHGLSIPEGGVHIVGGELGDAFIAFSTDEDARQAFNLNNGKIKEVQIKLMLSSRTEMQKVIEAARNQSLAAFMQTAAPSVHMPPILPSLIPSIGSELKKESSKERDSKDFRDRRDKRRSRSRSRDRKERSRDRDRDRGRDRRHRDRSRSRSRDRRDRRRRDRSRSRERTRSKDRDRDRKNKDVKGRTEERDVVNNAVTNTLPIKDQKTRIGVWENPNTVPTESNIVLPLQANNFVANNMEEPRRNLNNLNPLQGGDKNGFQNPRNNFNRQRESWPPGGARPGPNLNNDVSIRSEGYNNSEERFGQAGPRQSLLGNYNPRFQEGGGGFNRNMPIRPDGPNNRFDRQDADRQGEIIRNCCIQLQPFFGGYGEIRRFFQGLFINNTGIKFVNDEYGKRTSVVYIRFAFPEGKEKALQRNGGRLKNHVVEIAHLSDEDFDAAIDRFQPDSYHDQQDYGNSNDQYHTKNVNKFFNNRPNAPPQMLKVFTCLIVEDLPSFAKEQDIFKMFSDFSLDSIFMSSKPRNNHVAYVKFCNPDDAKKAFSDKSKHVFEGKPVHVRPCRDEEFESISNPQDDECEDDIIEESQMMIDTDCLHLSGLPLKISDRDVSDFFSDMGVVPIKVHLISGHLGFTGQAYCEFASEHDASIALEKDSAPLGTSIISVKPISRQEMMDDIMGHQNMQPNGPPLLQGPNPRPFFQRNNFGPGPRGHFNRPPQGRRFPPPPAPGMNDVPPGCTILMENVPYKAGLDEILEYFDGFEIPNDNVLRRFNDNGTPSGEAKVIFSSPDDAYQAVNEKRGHKIRDRLIFLTQC